MVQARWSVLAATVALVAFGATWGTGVLSGGGFNDPNSPSATVRQQVIKVLGPQDIDILVLYSSTSRMVDDPIYASSSPPRWTLSPAAGRWPGLAYEAIRRLVSPPEVTGALVLTTALVGVVINIAAAWMISRANRASLNVQGAFLHILTDLYAFIATAVAGLIMVLTGFARADAIASLVVVALMVKAGLGLVRDSGRIFLEAAPAGLDPAAVGQALANSPHVAEVHDLHIWQITAGMPAASAHLLVTAGEDCHAVRADLESLLARSYKVTHTTLQVDHAPDRLLAIGGPAHCDEPHGPVHQRGDGPSR